MGLAERTAEARIRNLDLAYEQIVKKIEKAVEGGHYTTRISTIVLPKCNLDIVKHRIERDFDCSICPDTELFSGDASNTQWLIDWRPECEQQPPPEPPKMRTISDGKCWWQIWKR